MTERPDTPPGDEPLDQEPASSKKQFGIAALFWLTFIVGISLKYLQQLSGPHILIGGLAAVTIGALIGLFVGQLTRRLADALFWSTLVSAFGYICLARDPANASHLPIAWSTVGAVAAAIGATVATNRIVLNAIACAACATVTMMAFWASGKQQLPVGPMGLDIDLIAAPVVGIGIAVLVRIMNWVESRHHTPRYLTATWLLVVVIVGNMIAG